MLRRRISTRFILAFALLLITTAGLGGFAVSRIAAVNALSAELRTRWLPGAQALGEVHAFLSQYRIKEAERIEAAPEAQERTTKLVRRARKVVDEAIGDYRKTIATPEQQAAFDAFDANWQAYLATSDAILANPDHAAARAAFDTTSLDQFFAAEDSVVSLVDISAKASAAVSARGDAIFAAARRVTIGAVCAALVLALAMLGMLMRTVARPMQAMSRAVEQLAAGDQAVAVPGMDRQDEVGSLARAIDGFKDLFTADHRRALAEQERAREVETTIAAIGGGLAALAEGNLTHRVPENGAGGLGKLHTDYNAAVASLTDVLGTIVSGCNTIRLGTEEIAAASLDLSRRTEHQAASLAETSRTLGEFSGVVKITADNARQTSSRLTVARETAARVEDISRQAAIAMRNIEGSSRQMAEIVNLIDGIAFQTNLLALNAGVEAARAGESGKGFAVVANEVRALAQRSADAARDIRELIGTSTGQVASGVSLVETSGEALRQIVAEVSAVAGLVDEIAEAAGKQASGIGEISQMVSAMDEFTQQNAAMVEQSSAGTRNLSDETVQLVERLGQFRLGGDPAPAPVPARTAPRLAASAPVRAAPPAFDGNAALAIGEADWAEF